MDLASSPQGAPPMSIPQTWADFFPYMLWLWESTSFASKMFLGLVGLMSLDIATGLIKSKALNVTNSKTSFVGISRKAMTLLAIFAARIFLAAIPEILPTLDLPSTPVLITTIIIWYQVNEMISINENYRQMGLSIPIISPLLKKLRELLHSVTTGGDDPTPPTPPLPPAPKVT